MKSAIIGNLIARVTRPHSTKPYTTPMNINITTVLHGTDSSTVSVAVNRK